MTNDSQTYSYSECREIWWGEYASPEEAAAAYFRDGGEFGEVWVGLNCAAGHASQYVNADDIRMIIEENAGDKLGEAAENWLSALTTADLEELKTIIGNWLQSKAPPDFYYVKELRQIRRAEFNEMGDVSLANEGKTAEVCESVQTGGESQASAVIGNSEGGETDAPEAVGSIPMFGHGLSCGACHDGCPGDQCKVERDSPPISDAQRAEIGAMNAAVAWPGQDVGAAVRIAELEATVSSQSEELDKAYRRDVMMGQTIGNHILAMSAAVIAREIDSPEKAWLWIENTLIGPGLYPDIEEAKALGGAQAWFNVQNDEERKRLKGISEEPDLNDHIKNAILAYLDEEKAAQTAELKATVASICERLGCDNLNGAEPALRSIDELHAQISSLTTNATNTRRALSDAINRLSADLATERQAREALQERAGG